MADPYSVTAPLMVRLPDGGKRVAVECFPHPKGLLFFELFWEQVPAGQGIQLLEGELRGSGPWRVGEAVISVLGCQGTEPELAGLYAQWRAQIAAGHRYPEREAVLALARHHGAAV